MEADILALAQLQSAILTRREYIGVRFLITPDEWQQSDAPVPKKPIAYCCMVRAATSGHATKCAAEMFACKGSKAALGMEEPREDVQNGQNFLRLGLYRDLEIARNMVENTQRSSVRAEGIEVRPLEEFLEREQRPDVVLMLTDAYGAMRILQGYSYIYGGDHRLFACGNQALCAEGTAHPMETGEINISFLCGGTRHRAGWRDDEILVGLPYDKFNGLAFGVMETINIMEPNAQKKEIAKRLSAHGLAHEMQYDFNYYRKVHK